VRVTGKPSWLVVVDRIEGSIVVLIPDEGETLNVPKDQLPPGIREGSVVRVPFIGNKPDWANAAIDAREAKRRLKESKTALAKLKRTDPGGDLKL
jgi:hypothetical protein